MRRSSEKSIIFILLLCGIGALAYLFFDWHEGVVEKVSIEETKKEKKKWESIINKLEADIAALKSKVEEGKPAVSEEKISESLGPELPLLIEKKKVDCDELKKQLSSVFEYLDGKEYIKIFKLKTDSQEHYNKVMNELSQNIPIASEMILDFDTLLNNILHFYQVLGKENVQMIKEILSNEEKNLETIMSVFFEYFMAGEQCQDNDFFAPSAVVRYEYAGFFLNTIGGRSYLFRRNSRLRILVAYYSVLSLHEANENVINQHGIDIRPHLDHVIEEIKARNDLTFQKNYLETLSAIKEKYPSS